MADIKDALANFQPLARMFRSVIEVADAMEGVGNIEQAASEHQIILNGLAVELKTARTALAKAKADASGVLVDAAEEAAAIKAKAKADAAAVTAKAAAVQDKAADEVKALTDAAHATVEAAHAEAVEAIAERDAAKQELADLQAGIDRARAKVAELLGS
jgi:hypothetical protein